MKYDKLIFVSINGKWKLHSLIGTFAFPVELKKESNKQIKEKIK